MKRHITTVAGTILLAIALSFIFGHSTAQAATDAKVSVPVLNVRLGPGTGYEKITCIKVGETYPVVDSRDGWFKLMVGTTPGWVCGDYVQTFEKETAAPPSVQVAGPDGRISAVDSVTVNVNLLNVRSGSSVKNPIIGGIKKGDSYPVLDYNSGWYKIKYNFSQGWICGDYVSANFFEDEEKQAQEQPQQPEFTGIYDVQDVEFLNTDTRNCTSIPVEIKVSKDDSAEIPIPGIQNGMTADGKINITLANSIFSGSNKDVVLTDNDLVSEINISAADQNTTTITISPKAGINYEVYTVQAKGYEDEEYKYYKYYIVASLQPNKGKSEQAENPDEKTGDPDQSIVKNSEGKTKHDYLVTLDAGHGGTTSGAVSNGLDEKVFNMDIITRVNDILKAQGYDTYLTRKDDTFVSLADRADNANILKSSIFVSVHLNSFTSSTSNGTVTLFNSEAKVSGERLASLIQNNLVLNLNRTDRGIDERPDLYVLNSTDMPAALAEILFMSNQDELNIICADDNRQKAAEAIAKGINEYFGFEE